VQNGVRSQDRRLSVWLNRTRETVGYDLVWRIFGSAWFFLLACLVLRDGLSGHTAAAAGMASAGWPKMASHIGLVLFYLTMWLLILIRPAPIRRAAGILPNVWAFVGTYMPWLIALFPGHELSDTGYIVATSLILGGNVLALFVICHLGRSFSFVPQARKLVTAGPYALVRHPLYLAEEVMIIGTVMLYLSPMTVVLLAVHMAVQVRRMLYEEDLLRLTFPDYADYAGHTARIVPNIW